MRDLSEYKFHYSIPTSKTASLVSKKLMQVWKVTSVTVASENWKMSPGDVLMEVPQKGRFEFCSP